MTKTIKVMSIGEIADSKTLLDNETLVISFCNTWAIDIIKSQKISISKNKTIENFKDNILIIKKNDIQNLSFFKYIRHLIFPYSYVFNKYDKDKIISFLNDRDYEYKNIIFQSEYGKSRSLSLAIAISKTLLKNTHILKHHDKKIRNKIIYSEMMKKEDD